MKPVSLRNLLLFWLTFLSLAALILFTTLMYSAPFLPWILLGLFSSLAAVWLVIQARRGMKAPHTGLGPIWLVGLGAAVLSTLLSSNPRMGLERLLWLGAAAFIFYMLLAVFRSNGDAQPILDGALWVGGIVALSACTETVAWYAVWRDAAGSAQIAPLYPYRFASLLGHANVYMGFMNLWAPLTVFSLAAAKTRLRRVSLLLWLVLYAISVPFSSSRGGWVGMVAWIGTLALLWSVTQTWSPGVWKWVRQKWLYTTIATVMLLGAGVVGYVVLSKSVTSHPTHGSSLFGSRGAFIQAALRAWQSAPWGGMGPGRFTFGWLEQGGSIPPGYWPLHAHNLWTQALAEFGPLGLIALCALLIAGGIKLWLVWKSAPGDHKLAIAAAIAGLCSWLVHSLVDEFSSLPFYTTSLAILAAYGISRGQAMARPGRWSVGWLLLPLALLTSMGGWSLWSSDPARAAAKAGEQANWIETVTGIEGSLARDPQLPFYSFQAGFAHAALWQESGDTQSLAYARQYLEQGIYLESGLAETAFRRKEEGYALWWANLAVLDFQAGDIAQAEEHIRQAVSIAPGEATFHLNLGWMMEELGREAEAASAYQKALELKPEWASHPFWQDSAIRERAVMSVPMTAAAQSSAYLIQAEQALQQGDLVGARRALAFSELTDEPDMARLVIRAQVAQAEGKDMAILLSVRNALARRQLRGTSVLRFSEIYNRRQLPMNLVPGYIQLDGDYGQYQAMESLHALQVEHGDCAEAAMTWTVWQQSLQGFAMVETLPAPLCGSE